MMSLIMMPAAVPLLPPRGAAGCADKSVILLVFVSEVCRDCGRMTRQVSESGRCISSKREVDPARAACEGDAGSETSGSVHSSGNELSCIGSALPDFISSCCCPAGSGADILRRRVGDDAGEGSAGGLGCCCCLALLCVVSWACDAPWSLPSVPLGGLHDRGLELSRCCWLSASSSWMAANGEAVQPAGLTDLLASGRPAGAQGLVGTSPPVWAGDGFVGSLTHLSQDRIQGCSRSSEALGRRAGSLASAAWMKLFAPRGIQRSYLEGGRRG